MAFSSLLLIPPCFVLPSLRVPVLPLMVPRWRTPPPRAFSPCRWRRRWEKLWPVETQPLQMLSDCWSQCVILSCSLFYWNVRYSFALSLQKADKSLCWWFFTRSLTQSSCLFVGINASHVDSVAISYSLSVGCTVADVNLGRCNRGTRHTSPSIRSLPETLGILRLFAIGPV